MTFRIRSNITLVMLVLCASATAAQGGVVVESLNQASALARADLHAGDVVHSWSLQAETTDVPLVPLGATGGKLTSAFDWWWLEREVAPLGNLELRGERAGRPARWTVDPGPWKSNVRPAFSDPLLAVYLEGRALIEAQETERGVRVWRRAFELAGDSGERCWLLLRTGEAQARARNWQGAQAAFSAAFELAQGSLAQVQVRLASGRAFRRQKDWQQAEAAFSEALEISENAWGETLSAAWFRLSLGAVAKSKGDIDRAEVHLRHALEIGERLAASGLVVAGAAVRLGLVAMDRDHLEAAEVWLRRGLEIYQRLAPDSLSVTACLSNLGVAAWHRGDLAAAESYYRRALEVEQRIAPGSQELAGTLNNLGLLASERGDLELAAGHYRRALALSEELNPGSRQVAIVRLNLGTIAHHRQDLAAAEDYFRHSLDYFAKYTPNSVELADVLDNLGQVARGRRDFDLAEDFHRRALDIRRQLAPDNLKVASSRHHLGKLFFERGDLERAEKYFRRALELNERHAPGSLRLAHTLHEYARVVSARGRLALATSSHQRALGIRQRLAPASRELAETLHALGTLARQNANAERAADYLYRACQAFEAQVERLGGSYDARSNFRARYRHLYRDAIEVSLEIDRAATAFHLLERSRARSLLAMLAERDVAFATDRLPDELRGRRRQLAIGYDRTLREMAALDPAHSAKVEESAGELARLRREREQLISEIRATSPRLATLRYPQPLELEQARAALDPGTVMLSYAIGKAEGSLFVVRPGAKLEVHPLEIGEDALRSEVAELLELVRRSSFPRHRSSFDAASRRLFDLLVAPATTAIEASRRLVIVPDGPLHTLPFTALLMPSAAGDQRRYLAAWKPVHSVQSATLYDELRKSRPAAGTENNHHAVQLAAFGDPSFPGGPRRRVADPRLRSATTRGLFDWQPLPHSRREVEEIAGLFAGATRSFLDQAASEEQAKSLGKDVRLVHFATHALVDDRFPLSSALALTIPERQSDDRDNGLLQAWEIFEKMRLDADLVVLSACRSGLGPEQAGEGLLGLTRAFQYAGARSVAASLWSVDDQSTAELMVRFYRHLRAGEPKDEALRSAQLELLRAPVELTDASGQTVLKDFSAPFYWAAFQIIGDWQ